jgi:hypothetical protein
VPAARVSFAPPVVGRAMIVETFFLMEEKRAYSELFFHDLLGLARGYAFLDVKRSRPGA